MGGMVLGDMGCGGTGWDKVRQLRWVLSVREREIERERERYTIIGKCIQ